jgi:hypothetical protein
MLSSKQIISLEESTVSYNSSSSLNNLIEIRPPQAITNGSQKS